MLNNKNIETSIRDYINTLYQQFSIYPCPKDGITTCKDYGPTQEEAIALAKPLKEISPNIIFGLEFYSNDQKEWGTQAEIKYLLPRIMECVFETTQTHRDTYSTYHFFSNKLLDLYDWPTSSARSASKWTTQEADCIKQFLSLYQEYLSLQDSEIGIQNYLAYMELLCEINPDVNSYLAVWDKVPATLKSKQIERWLKTHFTGETFDIKETVFSNGNIYAPHQSNGNLIKIKNWVLSEDNMRDNMALFSDGPWWKAVLEN